MITKRQLSRVALTCLYSGILLSASQALGDCSGCSLDTANNLGIPQVGLSSAVKDIIDLLSFVAGVLSAVFIVIGGIRYSTSSGNTQRVEGAKQTLTYAVIGLIISILAFAIVGFITAKSP